MTTTPAKVNDERPYQRARTALACRLAASILAIAVCALHFWKLGSAPAGFYGDECSQAYNAYCIARTGADEYGVRHPLFFRALDNYQDPVLIYCLAPLVNVCGLTKVISRAPSALFDLLAATAFAFLVQEYCRNKWLSLLGAALFSFIPWVFPASRLVFSDTAMLWGIIMGWWLCLLALRKRSYGFAVGAGVAWAFAMYARTLGRPMTVLLLLCFGLAFSQSLLARWKVALAFAIGYVSALLPMMISVARFPQSLTTRFEWISVFQGRPPTLEIVKQVGLRYGEYFSPRFLFLGGDPQLRHHTGFGGELFLFTVPLILVGICHAVRLFGRHPRYRLLAFSLLVYPVAAALTVDRMHSGRSLTGAISWLLVAMLGARALWKHSQMGRTLLLVICAAGLIECTGYFVDYFGPYQKRSSAAFQTGFTHALEYCFGHLSTNQVLYVSGSVGTACDAYIDTDFKPFAYIFLLFHGRIDPWSYQHTGFSNTVVQPYLESISRPGLLLRCNHTPDASTGQFLIVPNHESVPPDAMLLTTFQDEDLVYQVWSVKGKWSREDNAVRSRTSEP